MQESIPNPFKDDKPAAREYSPSMAPIMAQKLAAQGVSGKRYGLKMPTIKRVKAYELLVPPKNNIPPIEDTDFEGVQLDND